MPIPVILGWNISAGEMLMLQFNTSPLQSSLKRRSQDSQRVSGDWIILDLYCGSWTVCQFDCSRTGLHEEPTSPTPPHRPAPEALFLCTPVRAMRVVATYSRAFSVMTPVLWNLLPSNIRQAPSQSFFKQGTCSLPLLWSISGCFILGWALWAAASTCCLILRLLGVFQSLTFYMVSDCCRVWCLLLCEENSPKNRERNLPNKGTSNRSPVWFGPSLL